MATAQATAAVAFPTNALESADTALLLARRGAKAIARLKRAAQHADPTPTAVGAAPGVTKTPHGAFVLESEGSRI